LSNVLDAVGETAFCRCREGRPAGANGKQRRERNEQISAHVLPSPKDPRRAAQDGDQAIGEMVPARVVPMTGS
jgi:hypothetical protein